MSRIQLSQPSFANGFARSRGESARPDLWPDNAFVPVFGPTGATLFNLSGGGVDGTTVTGIWTPDGLYFNGTNYSQLSPSNLVGKSKFTIFAAFKRSNTLAAHVLGDGQYGRASYFLYIAAAGWDKSNFSLYTSGGYVTGNGPAGSTSLNDFTATVCYDVNKHYSFFNGQKYASVDCTIGTTAPSNDHRVGIIQIGTGSPFTGFFKAHYVYYRLLSDNQVFALHQDPYLPFRRRLQVFYSVPSAGGGTTYQGEAIDGISLGESTAARGIFGATAIDGIGMGEGRSGLLKALLAAADGIKLSDLSAGRLSITANGIDGITLTDAASAIAVLGALASDGITLSDTGSGDIGGLIGEAIDGFKIGDTSSSIASLIASAIDGATLGDSASTIASMISAAIDGIIFSDSAISGSFEGIAADGIKLTDSSLAMLRILKSVADGIAMSDTASGRVDFTVTCADGATFGETIGTIMTMLATASDTFNLGDIAVYLDQQIATITLSTRSPSITFTLRKPTITFN